MALINRTISAVSTLVCLLGTSLCIAGDQEARLGDDEYRERVAGLRWTFNRSWEIGCAYRSVDWTVASPEIHNDFTGNLVGLSVGYRW